MKMTRKIRSFQEDPTGEKSAARSKTNGFNRPLAVTSTMREFLGLEEGDTISRSDVTKRINLYVTENGLKHPDNGRVIIMDDKLTKLLDPPSGTTITYLNIQKYLSPHYIKDEKAEDKKKPAAATPAAKRPTTTKKVAATGDSKKA